MRLTQFANCDKKKAEYAKRENPKVLASYFFYKAYSPMESRTSRAYA